MINFISPSLTIVDNKKPLARFCSHGRVKLLLERRMIECRLCGKVIEPFEHILNIANRMNILSQEISIITNENAKLQSEQIIIKKEIRKLKAERRRILADMGKL